MSHISFQEVFMHFWVGNQIVSLMGRGLLLTVTQMTSCMVIVWQISFISQWSRFWPWLKRQGMDPTSFVIVSSTSQWAVCQRRLEIVSSSWYRRLVQVSICLKFERNNNDDLLTCFALWIAHFGSALHQIFALGIFWTQNKRCPLVISVSLKSS